MPGLIKRLFGKTPRKKPGAEARSPKAGPDPNRSTYSSKELKQLHLLPGLHNNLLLMKKILGENENLIIRKFRLGLTVQTEAAVVYLDGMIDKNVISQEIMKPLMLDSRMAGLSPEGKKLLEFIKDFSVTVSGIKDAHSVYDIITGVLYGDAALIIDGLDTALVM
ncbi:MAG: spore germination protein, partial [Desulfocucumaceae bacterium]